MHASDGVLGTFGGSGACQYLVIRSTTQRVLTLTVCTQRGSLLP